MISDYIYRLAPAGSRVRRFMGRVVRHLPPRRRVVRHHKQLLRVDPTEMSGFYLYYEREYDAHVFAFLEGEMPRYRRILDVGANIGVYTCFFAGRADAVTAFEPIPQLADCVRSNLRLNALTNVDIREVCVGDRHGEVTFQLPGAANSGIGQIVAGARPGTDTVTCPSIALDELFPEGASEPTLMKMDIEGAEWLALGSARTTFLPTGHSFSILLEVHPEEIAGHGGTTEALFALLVGHGFVISEITASGLRRLTSGAGCRFWWASRPGSQK